MKIRTGFVSNSSSSSFVISLSLLSGKQVTDLLAYPKREDHDWWNIYIDEYYVTGSTIMDNGDLGDYMNKIGINKNIVKWDE